MRAPLADRIGVILCEDIRREVTGRMSCMGVHGRGMDIEMLPAIIPQLACMVIVEQPHETLTSALIRMFDTSGQQTYMMETVLASPPDKPYNQHVAAQVFPVLITQPGTLRFSVTFNGDQELGVERVLDVRLRAPVASPPVPST